MTGVPAPPNHTSQIDIVALRGVLKSVVHPVVAVLVVAREDSCNTIAVLSAKCIRISKIKNAAKDENTIILRIQ